MALIKKIIDFFRNLFRKPPSAKAPEGKKVEPPKVAPAAAKALAGKKPAVGGKKLGDTYKIVKEPHISEKATQLGDEGKYTFKVFSQANKKQIKKAISDLYGVNVKDVKIINIKSKERTFRNIKGTKTGYKKAIITLEKGEKIEILPH
jgi:large subunit ribosomal protein L23